MAELKKFDEKFDHAWTLLISVVLYFIFTLSLYMSYIHRELKQIA